MKFFDFAYDLKFRGGSEGVSGALQQQSKMFCDVSTAQIDSSRGVRDRESLVDGACVGTAITYVQHDSSC